MNFENLIMGNEIYTSILKGMIWMYVIVLILCLIRRYVNKDIADALHLNIKFYKFVPRILINGIIIFLVFGWNYESKTIDFSIKEDMLVTTFLVGILAIMDLISTVVNLYSEFKEANENNTRKEIDEIKRKINELEKNNK